MVESVQQYSTLPITLLSTVESRDGISELNIWCCLALHLLLLLLRGRIEQLGHCGGCSSGSGSGSGVMPDLFWFCV